MPDTANKALEGMLAEGVTAAEVLEALGSSGYDVKPPEDDESYDEPSEEEGGAALIIGVGTEPEMPEEPSEEEEAEGDKRLAAAKKAMNKHGF
jgi:hypothetical protein